MDYLVYTAGPITGLSYKGATGWREYVEKKMPDYIHTVSPMRGKQRLELMYEEEIKDSYEDNPLTSEKGISARDYNDVKRSSAILVNFLGVKRPSLGTVMEIAWAKAFQIPVVLVMEKDNVHNHSMIRNACGFIVDDLDLAIELVITIVSPDRKLHALKPSLKRKPDLHKKEGKAKVVKTKV